MRAYGYNTTPAEVAAALQLDTTKPIPETVPEWQRDQCAGWWGGMFLVMTFAGRIEVFLVTNEGAVLNIRMSLQAPAPETPEEFREWVQKALIKFKATRERAVTRLSADLNTARQELEAATGALLLV